MKRTSILLIVIGVAAAVTSAGWWYYWPVYQLHQAEKALAANDLPRADALLQPLTSNARARTLEARVLRRLAEGQVKARRWTDADDCYTRWLNLEPERLDARLARAQARLAAARDDRGSIDAAVADFREVLRRTPNDFDAHLALAQALLSDARMSEARTELLACQRLRPQRVEPLLGLATCAMEERRWDEARALLRQALHLEPQSSRALTMLGDVCLRQERYAEAVPYFQQVLRVDPQNRNAHLKLAQALRFSGRPDEARREEELYQRQAPAN
ncbi:MAG TPA: tetratricopeptide repeat protein [Gemmataceae bacterium]|nr:tetratricopeptide repeat protein [Gemmataceae bacterium]